MQPRVIRLNAGMIAVWALTLTAANAMSLLAQEPAADSSPVTTPYLAPQLALVQPAAGADLAQDNPAVVFRLAQGDSSDALDLASFEVAIDGVSRTPQFRVDSTEAWGSLDPPASPGSARADAMLDLGAHLITARICSVRSICTDARAAVTVVSSANAVSDPAAAKPKKRLVAVIVLILALIRRLITL